LAISSINVTQLPLLVPGNEPELDGKHWHISFDIPFLYYRVLLWRPLP
jgi:hypothetical protein